MKGKYRFLKAVKFVVMIAAFLAVLGFVVMQLWNWLVPAVFSGPLVSYWQALGLLVLARLLCGGFRPHHHGHHRFGGPPWKHMTPDEREELRNRFRERWGRACMPGRPPEKDPQA